MKTFQLLGSVALLGTTVLLSDAALAASWDVCGDQKVTWDSNAINLRSASVSFPSGSSWLSALSTSISRVNENPSPFNFSLTSGDTSVGFDNGQNEIWFSSDSAYSPAVTYTWTTCYWLFGYHTSIDETDIVFYNGTSYTTSTSTTALWPYGGASRPFHTTAIHELGHALGLNHVNTEYNIMGQDWTHIHANGSSTRAYFGEDASDGAVALYGLGSGEDVGLVQWKHLGASGEYSTHQRTKLYNTSGVELAGSSFEGARRYNVNKGQTVQLELTAENNGAHTQNPSLGFYVSTNNIISTGDTLIGTGGLTLSRDNVYTFKVNVVIPNNLVSGSNYWLGAVIDRTGSIAEITESNNATYIPIRVN